MALTEALAHWRRPYLKSDRLQVDDANPIRVDNQAAIHLSQNPEFHRRTKHVGIKYHRIPQEQDMKVVSVEYVQTDQNPADMLTKADSRITLDRNRFELRIGSEHVMSSERRCSKRALIHESDSHVTRIRFVFLSRLTQSLPLVTRLLPITRVTRLTLHLVTFYSHVLVKISHDCTSQSSPSISTQ